MTTDIENYELPDLEAVIAHIQDTFDDLEVQPFETPSIGVHRVILPTKESVIYFLRTSSVLDFPDANIELSRTCVGFVIDRAAKEVQ